MPARFEALAALGGLDRAGLHAQLAAAIDVVLVVKRCRDGTRYLQQIGVLEGEPVRARVVWDVERGALAGYEELAP